LKHWPWLIFLLQFLGFVSCAQVCSLVLASTIHPVAQALTFVSESLLSPHEVLISTRLCSIFERPGSAHNRERRPDSLLSSCSRCPALDFSSRLLFSRQASLVQRFPLKPPGVRDSRLTAECPRLFFPLKWRGQGSCLALTPFSTGACGLGVISLLRLQFSWFGDRVHRDLLLPIIVPLVCAPVKVFSMWFGVQPFVVRSSVFCCLSVMVLTCAHQVLDKMLVSSFVILDCVKFLVGDSRYSS
jgi:hypothetical protein